MRCIPTKQPSLYILLTSIVLENPNIILSENHYIIISVQNYRIILEKYYFREKYSIVTKTNSSGIARQIASVRISFLLVPHGCYFGSSCLCAPYKR